MLIREGKVALLICLLKSNTTTKHFFFLLFQSSIQDWGEEVEEGAVYHVTLKRVQIQQAANKGARWLGVSKNATLASWANARWTLESWLEGADFPRQRLCQRLVFALKSLQACFCT